MQPDNPSFARVTDMHSHALKPSKICNVLQASKADDAQPMIADRLASFNPASGPADVCVVGCGPAGLALAAELAANGVNVALVGQSFIKGFLLF